MGPEDTLQDYNQEPEEGSSKPSEEEKTLIFDQIDECRNSLQRYVNEENDLKNSSPLGAMDESMQQKIESVHNKQAAVQREIDQLEKKLRDNGQENHTTDY